MMQTVHDAVQDVQAVCRWLEQVKKLDELIDAKCAERDQVFSLATKLNAEYDGMPHAKGNVSDPVGSGAVKLAMLERELDMLIDRYVDYKQKVIKILEKLPEKEYGVLHRYYIRYMSLPEIAEAMGYSTMQIWRIKKKALENLQHVVECYIIPVV